MDAFQMLLNSSTRHARSILSRIPPSRPVRGVEVGVARGKLSACLLGNRPELTLDMVDHWNAHDPQSEAAEWARAHDEPCNQLTQLHMEDNRGAAMRVAEKYSPRARIVAMSSVTAAQLYDEGDLDFVFIDADHRYEQVLDDLRAWLPRVRPGGWIGGHDYKTPGMGTGVHLAVSELVGEGRITEPELGEFYTWFSEPRGTG